MSAFTTKQSQMLNDRNVCHTVHGAMSAIVTSASHIKFGVNDLNSAPHSQRLAEIERNLRHIIQDAQSTLALLHFIAEQQA